MRRVLVIGIPGAGKSTYARALAAKTGLPVIHLDAEFWRAGWKVTPRTEWRAKVSNLVMRDAWIMDGNYGATLDLRLPRADKVFWFDYSCFLCLWRVAWRIARGYGQVRPDLAAGCPERFDREFLRYIWDFNANSRPQIVSMLAEHGRHLDPVVFRCDADGARFLAAAQAS